MTALNPSRQAEVARILGQATLDVLWSACLTRVHAASPAATLVVRVGRGLATNHRPPRSAGSGSQTHVITFGRLMVRSKFQGHEQAAGWTTGREIVRHGFFGGRFDLLDILAQTACHEFAHLLQHVEGQRRYRSVHNPALYRILSELHESGLVARVRAHVEAALLAGGLPTSWPPAAAGRGKPAARALSVAADRSPATRLRAEVVRRLASVRTGARRRRRRATQAFQPGDRVQFVSQHGTVVGRVKRINQKTVTVIPDKPMRPGQYWRVRPSLLRCVDEG